MEVDEFCIKDRLSFYIECKNKFSDCLTAPKKGTKLYELGEDMRQVVELFTAVSLLGRGHHPVLLASLIDQTFYGFQQQYSGYSIQTLFQLLKPEDAPVAARVREVFGIGNVKAVGVLPDHVARSLGALPKAIRRDYP